MSRLDQEEARVVRQEVLRLSVKAWGVSFGLLGGLGLFVSTLILVMKGGERVGPHLGLLSVYLPGYRVTVAGAFLGFIYLFVIGYAVGKVFGTVYNRLVGPHP